MATIYVIATIDLNIVPFTVITPEVRVSQYDGDSTRQIQATIYHGENKYTIPANSKVYVNGTKPDGKGFSYQCKFSGSVVSIPVLHQMTFINGLVSCEVVFLDSEDNQIGAANFALNVERAALQVYTLESSNDFQTFASYVDDAEYYSTLSKSWAVGLTNDREDEDENNSKYWAEQSAESGELSEYWAKQARRFVGITPIAVSTASGMTNRNAVYIYTGNESGYTKGDWYYHNGTRFVSGGTYMHAPEDILTFSVVRATSDIVII